MWTKLIKKIIKFGVRMAGHCDDGGGGHTGHCY